MTPEQKLKSRNKKWIQRKWKELELELEAEKETDWAEMKREEEFSLKMKKV